MARSIYLASSWRNLYQPALVRLLREEGHICYDFRNPPNKTGFSWQELSPTWKDWTAKQYVQALDLPRAQEGFMSDFRAMMEADTCVLLLPSGRSAHLEAGVMIGWGKKVAILTQDGEEPELMAKMADAVVTTIPELFVWLNSLPPALPKLIAAE